MRDIGKLTEKYFDSMPLNKIENHYHLYIRFSNYLQEKIEENNETVDYYLSPNMKKGMNARMFLGGVSFLAFPSVSPFVLLYIGATAFKRGYRVHRARSENKEICAVKKNMNELGSSKLYERLYIK